MNLDEYNGKAVVMVNEWAQNIFRVSINEFCKNIGCIVSSPTFGIGGGKAVLEEIGNKDK